MRDLSDNYRRIGFLRGKLHFYQPKESGISVDKVVFLSKRKGGKKGKRAVELGAGFGFLSISLAKKYNAEVLAVEIDELMYELLKENIEINRVQTLVKPLKLDIRHIREHLKGGSFDAVFINPPFYPTEYSPKPNPYEFEVMGQLKDFIEASSFLLRDSGYLNILLPSFRLPELFYLMNSLNINPSELNLIYPTLNKGGKLAIVVGRKNLKPNLTVGKPIVLNRGDGSYMPDISMLLEAWL